MSIRAENVDVRFGGIKALAGVSVEIPVGRIVAVVGPNGSGKSTLFNTISGLVPLAGGKILIDELDVCGVSPADRVRLGVARTFQTPRFDPAQTVEDAVRCGFFPSIRTGMLSAMLRLSGTSREEATVHEGCRELLSRFGLTHLARVPLAELSMGQLRMVEVVRAVANKPKYILLDEPAAGLSSDEQATLADQVRAVAASGVGTLLVEHNFNLIRQLAEYVFVLDRGLPILQGTPAEIESNEEFVSLYLGKRRSAGKPS